MASKRYGDEGDMEYGCDPLSGSIRRSFHRGLRSAGQIIAVGRMSQSEKDALIRKVAKRIYEKNGLKPGHDLDNWLEAERQVLAGKFGEPQ
jgi:hypothetical protein